MLASAIANITHSMSDLVLDVPCSVAILERVERLHEVSVSRADAGYHQNRIDHASKECGVLESLYCLCTCTIVYIILVYYDKPLL